MSLVGNPQPRVCTQPLHDLSDQKWTRGHEAIQFARERIGEPLYPWQEEALRRGLELNEDGSYRFDVVLVIVARQNGKSHLLRTLSLWKMYTNPRILVCGAAQSLKQAKEVWDLTVDTARFTDGLREEVKTVRTVNGNESLALKNSSRYIITAATRGAGRGLSVDQLNIDELREWRDEEPWDALSPTTTAKPNSQIWIFTNAGDDQSVVLNRLQATALDTETTCLLEWSAPSDCELDDEEAWCYANPSLGHIPSLERKLRGLLTSDRPSSFRTERLCQRVVTTNESAVDMDAWAASEDAAMVLDPVKDRVCVGIDVSLDGQHVAAVAAASDKAGLFRVEVIGAWSSVQDARVALPELLRRIKPRQVAWYGSGPTAPLAGLLRTQKNAKEIKGPAVSETCMVAADLIASRRVRHNGDQLLFAHLAQSTRMPVSDGWRFMRRGAIGHVNSCYALAAALDGAASLPSIKRARTFVVG